MLVENKAGVLARVAGLFSRRGYNIFSLAVAPTDNERFSRISIVVDVESSPLEQVVAQLDKLINVVEIGELASRRGPRGRALARERDGRREERSQVIQLVGVFAGAVVDVGHDAITVMVAGAPECSTTSRPLSPTDSRHPRTAGSHFLSWTPGSARGGRRPDTCRAR